MALPVACLDLLPLKIIARLGQGQWEVYFTGCVVDLVGNLGSGIAEA
jgi:hypothetical protein